MELLAPEVLEHGRHSIASDVWSFGVVMWEILSFGKIPYTWLSNKEVSEQVPRGERWLHTFYLFLRLPKPAECPDDLWKIISSCFAQSPDERPSFSDLLKSLTILGKKQQNAQEVKREPESPRNENYNIYLNQKG